jgi:p-hydroxybenzoate 3-monooxygenase
MNLALADVRMLARALDSYYKSGKTGLLESYSDTCLKRVWKAQRFSWWMTQIFHVFPDEVPFDRKRQLAELDYIAHSRAAQTSLAEQYTGLPIS